MLGSAESLIDLDADVTPRPTSPPTNGYPRRRKPAGLPTTRIALNLGGAVARKVKAEDECS